MAQPSSWHNKPASRSQSMLPRRLERLAKRWLFALAFPRLHAPVGSCVAMHQPVHPKIPRTGEDTTGKLAPRLADMCARPRFARVLPSCLAPMHPGTYGPPLCPPLCAYESRRLRCPPLQLPLPPRLRNHRDPLPGAGGTAPKPGTAPASLTGTSPPRAAPGTPPSQVWKVWTPQIHLVWGLTRPGSEQASWPPP